MAALFCESFDYLVTADLLERWSSLSGTPTIVGAAGRHSSACLRMTNPSWYVEKTVAPSGGTCVVGWAGKYTQDGANDRNVLAVYDGGTVQINVTQKADGNVDLKRNTTVLATSSTPIVFGAYQYFELKVVIHDTAGSVEFRQNGTTIASASNVDTNNGASAWTKVRWWGGPSGTNDLDDFYILDGSGSALNDFLGDVRVDAHYPTSDGATTDWVPSTGTDNFAMVDDAAPDDDTTYNETGTLNAYDRFGCTDLIPTGASIRFVEVIVSAKKTDAGAASIAPLIRNPNNTTDYIGTDKALSTTYAYYSQVYEKLPDGATGTAWDETNFEGAEFGYKKTV